MRKRLGIVVVSLALVATLSSCQSPVTMWQACAAAGQDVTGTDGTYVLVCDSGAWVPLMTVDEFVRLSRGEKVTRSPLPTRPTTSTTIPTTSTSAPTTSTTSTSTTTTTSTTVLVTATLVFSNAQDSTFSNFGFLTGSGLQPGATVTSCSDQFGCGPSGVTVDVNGNASHSGAMFAAHCRTGIYFTSTTAGGTPITSNTATYPAGTPGCP